MAGLGARQKAFQSAVNPSAPPGTMSLADRQRQYRFATTGDQGALGSSTPPPMIAGPAAPTVNQTVATESPVQVRQRTRQPMREPMATPATANPDANAVQGATPGQILTQQNEQRNTLQQGMEPLGLGTRQAAFRAGMGAPQLGNITPAQLSQLTPEEIRRFFTGG